MYRQVLLGAAIFAALIFASCTVQTAPTSDSPPPTADLSDPSPFPTETLPPSPTPTATAAPPTLVAGEDVMVLPPLTIAVTPPDIPAYDRDEWDHWTDNDGNCRDARHDVLVIESIIPVTFREGRECFVIEGHWLDPYTGIEVADPSELDIDHMVPLQNAHISGGWQWDPERKQEYANHMDYNDHLIAVTASANRSKGSRSPDEWKPPLESYWCDYAIDWVNIKAQWDLFATEAEWAALLEMLDTCPVEVAFDDGDTPVAVATPTLTPTATVPPAAVCVDLNTASLEDLQRISHIGEVRALEIISLRPFSSVQDLDRVSGIGPSRLNDIVAQGLACVT